MRKLKIRKDVALIFLGALLAVTSFVINWTMSTAIDRRLFEIDEQLQDIDRYLTFARLSVLEAFELSSSSKVDIAISQLMYFQFLKQDPDEAIVNVYNAMVKDAINRQASAVSAAHAAATGTTIEGVDAKELFALAADQDQSRASSELMAIFNSKLQQYLGVAEEKVILRRELVIKKKQLESRRSIIGNLARLIQLLAILIILAKDIVVAKKPKSESSETQAPDAEVTREQRMAA